MDDLSEKEGTIFVVEAAEAGERLDKMVASRFPSGLSRTYVQHLIASECILVNGSPVKKRQRFVAGDEVAIIFLKAPASPLAPEPIPLDILYEDEDLLVINKPAGMVVHPAPGNDTGTVAHALLYYCRDLQPTSSDDLRPGIVHRLDKETSGVLLTAKNAAMQQRLMALFAARKVVKEYTAICIGNPGNRTIDAPIGRHPTKRKEMAVVAKGKEAVTHIETLAYNAHLALVRVRPITGRTHQIRVHLRSIHAPILGDPLYGNTALQAKWGVNRLQLHAASLSFLHPKSQKNIVCKAPLPDDMRSLVSSLESCSMIFPFSRC